MTWWSEHSAVPRFVLAKSAIRCRFVDRFVGFSAPSHVSGQRVSPRGTLLPSSGSRPARFPAFLGTMGVLRLPARAYLLPYGFGCRSHVHLLCSWSPRRSWWVRRKSIRPGTFDQPAFPDRRAAHVDACGISQVPWRSVPCLCPAPRPRPSRQDLALAILSMLPPGNPDRRPQRAHISRLTQGFSIRCLRFTGDVTVSHARLASGWRSAPLPGGGRTLWIASKGFRLHYHSPFQDLSCRKGGLCQAALWRTRGCARLPVPLHAQDRYCQ